jgi:hypothetical protein
VEKQLLNKGQKLHERDAELEALKAKVEQLELQAVQQA